MLRACARLLRPGGRMAFVTIHPAPGLAGERLRRAIESGPPEVALDRSHEELLAEAGFGEIEAIDVTAAFSVTQQAWVDAWGTREQALAELLGRELLDERKAERVAMRAGIDEELLRRTLYVAELTTE